MEDAVPSMTNFPSNELPELQLIECFKTSEAVYTGTNVVYHDIELSLAHDELSDLGNCVRSSTPGNCEVASLDCNDAVNPDLPKNDCVGEVNELSNPSENIVLPDSLSAQPSPTSVKGVRIGRLPKQMTPKSLKDSIENIREFYSITINPLRRGPKFASSTLNKLDERISCFLNFCRLRYPDKTLEFNLVNDFEIVESYIAYQLEDRGLSASTVVRMLSALINLTKYVHRHKSDVDSLPELIRLGNVQRQLSKEEKSHRLAVKAGLSGNNDQKFLYTHLLECLRKLREKFESEDSMKRLRILHDFVLISLYATSMCGRSKEVRTLRIFDEAKEGRLFSFNWKDRCNILVVSAGDGKIILYENDFKNLSSRGPSKMILDEPSWFIPYLKLYLDERKNILQGKSHEYMFMNTKGGPFSCSAISSYLSNVFEREVNVRASTTKLRHALVTHVLSLPESDSVKLRESLAVLMRHSVKHQQFTYSDLSRMDKTAMSRELLSKSLEKATCVPFTNPCGDDSNTNKAVVHSSNAEIGDVCAVLDAASSCAKDAIFFLGKVVKLSDDGIEALLMEIRRIPDKEGSQQLYRAQVDNSWWEPVNALIFPVDIIYDKKRKLYELRSTAEEIYAAVFLTKTIEQKNN